MKAQKQNLSQVFSEFAGALHSVNSGCVDKAYDDEERAELKRQLIALYDLTATWKNVRAWNWGFDDEAIHHAIQEKLPHYNAADTDGFSEQLYYFVLHQIPTYIQAGQHVLEVGCGSGAGLNFLSRCHQETKFTGLDLSKVSIDSANRRLSRPPGLKYIHGDAESLPFPDGQFDAVICVESAHNYPDFGRFLSEVCRVLKPGGYLSIADLYTCDRFELASSLIKSAKGMSLVVEADISPWVKKAVRKRMDPGSLFRRTSREAFRFPIGPLNERAQMLAYGAEFVGVEDDFILNTVKRLTTRKSKTRLVFDRYHHHLLCREG